MLNKVTLIGNIGKDPEVKYAPSGTQIAKFSLATSESYKKDDNWEQKTEWHNIICFNKTAEIVEKSIKKGNTVYLEGKITTRSWEDNGVKKYMTEIVCNSIKNLSKNEKQEGKVGNDVEDDSMPF